MTEPKPLEMKDKPLTAHEVARRLLAGPDVMVVMDSNDEDPETVIGVSDVYHLYRDEQGRLHRYPGIWRLTSGDKDLEVVSFHTAWMLKEEE